MAKGIREGISGGLDLLEREKILDSEEVERREPKRFRPIDPISNALKGILGKDVGPYITDKQFEIKHELARPTDLTFDRWFPNLHLLMHSFFPRTSPDYPEDVAVKADIEEMREFAAKTSCNCPEANGDLGKHAYFFIPIINSEIDPDDIERLKNPPPHLK